MFMANLRHLFCWGATPPGDGSSSGLPAVMSYSLPVRSKGPSRPVFLGMIPLRGKADHEHGAGQACRVRERAADSSGGLISASA